jgi:hypothetical protein
MKQKLKTILEHRYVRGAGEIAQQVFVVLLVTYLLLLLAETIWAESASGVLNLNHLLIAVIAVGIPAVLTAPGKQARRARQPIGFKDIVMVACAATAGLCIVWYKTRDIGWPSYLMAIISCALIIILSLLILKEDDGGKNKEDQ